jgi:hypothetical protein
VAEFGQKVEELLCDPEIPLLGSMPQKTENMNSKLAHKYSQQHYSQ